LPQGFTSQELVDRCVIYWTESAYYSCDRVSSPRICHLHTWENWMKTSSQCNYFWHISKK